MAGHHAITWGGRLWRPDLRSIEINPLAVGCIIVRWAGCKNNLIREDDSLNFAVFLAEFRRIIGCVVEDNSR